MLEYSDTTPSRSDVEVWKLRKKDIRVNSSARTSQWRKFQGGKNLQADKPKKQNLPIECVQSRLAHLSIYIYIVYR